MSMGFQRSQFRLVSVLLVTMMGLSACGPKVLPAEPSSVSPSGEKAAAPGKKGQEQTAPHGELVQALINNPVQFNPILTSDLIGNGITARIFSGLVEVGPNMTILPDIATKWGASPDGLVWVFELRKDVKFHDGKPLTSADVAYTFNAIKDKGYTGPRTSVFKSLEKAEALDPYTVKFTLSESFAPFLTTLTYGILPKHLFDHEPVAKMKDSPLNRKPIGSGPWKFKEWKEGEYIILEANTDYYVKGEPKIAQIRYKFVPDEDVAAAQFEAGQIDFYSPAGKDVNRLKQLLGNKIKTATYETLGYNYLGFNLTRPGLSDKAVRQAIAYAVNRQQIVDNILAGQGVMVHTDTPPASQWYNPSITTYSNNTAKAMQLLEGAGYQKGSDGIYAKDKKKLSYGLMYSAGSSTRDSTAQLIQANLKEIGIALELKPTETAVFLQKYVWMGDFDMMINSFSLGVDPDMYSRWHSSQAVKNATGRFVGFNRGNYVNSQVDALIEEGRMETDPVKRRPIYNELQQILAEDLPALFLYTTTTTEMIKSKFTNLTEGYTGFMFAHQWDIGE